MPIHSQRGQVLPIWIGIVILSIAFIGVLADIGSVLAWQIRAQAAADAAAAVEVSTQASQWNREEALVYAGRVEEDRFRQLFLGTLLAANSDGPCAIVNTCVADYGLLLKALTQSSNRYTDFSYVLQQTTQNMNFGNQQQEAFDLVNMMQSPANCGTPKGLDCGFTYYPKAPYGQYIADASKTAQSIAQGATCWSAMGGTCAWTNWTGPSFANLSQNLSTPAFAEVTVCHSLSLPIALPNLNTIHIVAHGASRTWTNSKNDLYPGRTVNTVPGAANPVYQPFEDYTSIQGMGYYDWYDPGWSSLGTLYNPGLWLQGQAPVPFDMNPDIFTGWLLFFGPRIEKTRLQLQVPSQCTSAVG